MTPDFRIWRYSLPLAAPVSLAPGVAMSVREGLLLEIVEGGRSFWGEAAPLPGFSRESLDEARKALDEVAGKLSRAGESWRGFAEGLAEGFDAAPSLRLSPSAEFALASAFAEIDGGGAFGKPSPSVAMCGLLSGSREEILSDATELRRNGYEAAKLKVGRGEVEDDAALVGEVREILGGDVSLRLDANRAWSFEEALRFAGLVEGADISFVEEPLEDAGRLRELSEGANLPVALDESLAAVEADGVEGCGYARALVLKPTVIGFSRTVAFAALAKRLGVKAIISSSYESGVGMLALLRLAAAGEAAAGLDTHRRLADDVLSPPLELSKPRVDTREVFGMKRKMEYEKLERIA